MPVPGAPTTEHPVAGATEKPPGIRLRFPPHDEGTEETRAGGGRALPPVTAGDESRRGASGSPPIRAAGWGAREEGRGSPEGDAAPGVAGSRPAPEETVTPIHPAVEERQENPRRRKKWQEETLTRRGWRARGSAGGVRPCRSGQRAERAGGKDLPQGAPRYLWWGNRGQL